MPFTWALFFNPATEQDQQLYTYVTGPAKIIHVNGNYIFTNIFSYLQNVSTDYNWHNNFILSSIHYGLSVSKPHIHSTVKNYACMAAPSGNSKPGMIFVTVLLFLDH